MRPDLEDYEELNQGAEAPRSRAMSWLVLVVAVGGFASLAYYAYHSGTQNIQGGDMMVVQADNSPIKAAPTDPEGEQFANKDKTIYDVITPNGTQPQQKVEKLLPDPEKPLNIAHGVRDSEDANEASAPAAAASAAAPSTTTFVNKNLNTSSPTTDPVDAASSKQPVTVATPTTSAPVPIKKTDSTINPPATATAAQVAANTAASGPSFVNEAPVATTTKKTTATVAATPAKKTPASKPVEKKAVAPTSAAKGAYSVQLGAYKTEEEAQASWKKISAKFSGTLSGGPSIVKADLPNGTFYRLRASGFASTDAAKAACAKLTAQKQACFPVGK